MDVRLTKDIKLVGSAKISLIGEVYNLFNHHNYGSYNVNLSSTAPATTAVTRPACAPTPDVAPNANASGRATIATVTPAIRSRRGERLTAVQSSRRGSKPTMRSRSSKVSLAYKHLRFDEVW